MFIVPDILTLTHAAVSRERALQAAPGGSRAASASFQGADTPHGLTTLWLAEVSPIGAGLVNGILAVQIDVRIVSSRDFPPLRTSALMASSGTQVSVQEQGKRARRVLQANQLPIAPSDTTRMRLRPSQAALGVLLHVARPTISRGLWQRGSSRRRSTQRRRP